MESDIYKQLAKHLDDMPAGFPPSENGAELRILKKFFSPEEAELALKLTLIPEEPRVIARRAKISKQEAEKRLEDMAQKGQIFRIEVDPGKPMYMASQYVVGIWEFNVNNLDTEVIKDMYDYIPTLLNTAWKTPQLRTIPVGQSINNELEVMTYEKARELVKNHKKFSVNPCICRRERKMVGEGCDKPEHSCLAFGIAADYYIKNGIGRESTKDEIIELLDKANENGFVLQPGNSQEVDFICCCCGCCCGVLRTLKKTPRPIEYFSAPFLVEINQETCEGCGLCEERCQMEALQLVDDDIYIDLDRCIGCGLCVSTCPTESLSLKRRPAEDQFNVPKDGIARAIEHGRQRGMLGPLELVKMQVRSKVDRFLAPR